jgi:alpha-beta hydrolase superfamily lysophospholipase
MFGLSTAPRLADWQRCFVLQPPRKLHGRSFPVLKLLKVAAGILAGISVVTFVGPLVGEAIATLPPPFSRGATNPMLEFDLPYEEVAFPTESGLTLRGWFVPGRQSDAPAIVYAPATAHDQRSGLSIVPALHDAGYHVLLFSYRGHALSEGVRGRFTYGDAESRDVDAAVSYLYEKKGVRSIGIIGHSAGAVSALLSAARNLRVGGVIAVAPYNCVGEVWATNRPALVPRFMMDWTLWAIERMRGFRSEDVCPEQVVADISPRPVLIIHGTGDRRITEDQARRLFAAAGEPKSLWLVDGATHGGIQTLVLDELAPEVIAFLDDVLIPGPDSARGVTRKPAIQPMLQQQDSIPSGVCQLAGIDA